MNCSCCGYLNRQPAVYSHRMPGLVARAQFLPVAVRQRLVSYGHLPCERVLSVTFMPTFSSAAGDVAKPH